MDTTYTFTITQQEHSLIIAALRNWQYNTEQRGLHYMTQDYGEYFLDECGPMPTEDEIELFVDRFLFADADKPKPVIGDIRGDWRDHI